MKNSISILLAFLIFGVAFQPCLEEPVFLIPIGTEMADEHCATAEEGCCGSEFPSSQHPDDDCSSGCLCDCCISVVWFPAQQIIAEQTSPVRKTYVLPSSFRDSEFTYLIWQPPRLG